MKSTLFRLAWWLARKTAPGPRFNLVRVLQYNDGTIIRAITVTEIDADDNPSALLELSEGFAECADRARQEAAKAELDAELNAAIAVAQEGA